MKVALSVKLRPLTAVDLDGANAVIEAAIMTWQLPDRVKRLSLPSYRYDSNDLAHLTLVGAVDEADAIVGVVSWEAASASDTPNGVRGPVAARCICPTHAASSRYRRPFA